MNMPKIAAAVGVLLVIQGLGFYAGTGWKSPTALIPAAFGLPILLLGAASLKQSLRMHAMHAAAAVAALGLLAALGELAAAGIRTPAAGAALIMMILLCGGYVALSFKSFVDARRSRREGTD